MCLRVFGTILQPRTHCMHAHLPTNVTQDGDNAPAGDEDGAEDTAEAAEPAANEGEGGQDEEKKDEAPDDEELAWEMLEVAKSMYERMPVRGWSAGKGCGCA